jgi:DNA-binding transcriptional regulator YiaG
MENLPADLPAYISEHVIKKIRAGLLRVHSQHLEKTDLNTSLRASYDMYAAAFKDDSHPLTDALLTEHIPGWVFYWAVGKKWIPYPPRRFVPGRGNLLEGWLIQSTYRPVPDHELTVFFGGYMVTAWYKADIMNRLASRIAHWQSEALMLENSATKPTTSETGPPKPETTGAQIKRLREECRWTIEELAAIVDLNARTVSRHESGETKPYKRNTSTYERIFSKQLERRVVINKMP